MSATFVPEIDLDTGTEHELAEQLYNSLTTVGFACLKSAQLWEEADRYVNKAKSFFELSDKEKQKYAKPNDEIVFGWMAKDKERLNPERPCDFKETFNINYTYLTKEDAMPPEMYQEEAQHLWETFSKVSEKVLRLIGISLELKDPDYLNSVSHYINPDQNPAAMRINYYPALIDSNKNVIDMKLLKNQVRCGEHSDYGSITLLYTQSPGLEVLNRTTGEYLAAGQKNGAIYVNIGDMLQMWTDDVLIANKHRVIIPTDEEHLKSDRFSIPFFCFPDNDTLIQSLLGFHKHPPVRAGDWLKKRFDAVYIRT